MTLVPSVIAPLEVAARDSRLGRYVLIHQGPQSVSVELEALPELLAALCEAAGHATIALELGNKTIRVPGALGLPPGEYTALVMVD